MKTTKTYSTLCTTCNGTGYVVVPIPIYVNATTYICPVCKGLGTITVTEVTES